MQLAVQAHLDRAFLRELWNLLEQTDHNPNTFDVIRAFQTRIRTQLECSIPDHNSVRKLGDEIRIQTPSWWKKVRICYKYTKRINNGRPDKKYQYKGNFHYFITPFKN